MRSRLRVALLIVGVSVLLSAPARADQIALTSGLIDLMVSSVGANGPVQLAGDRGFTFVGISTGASARLWAIHSPRHSGRFGRGRQWV
jgi:hypothetical protein